MTDHKSDSKSTKEQNIVGHGSQNKEHISKDAKNPNEAINELKDQERDASHHNDVPNPNDDPNEVQRDAKREGHEYDRDELRAAQDRTKDQKERPEKYYYESRMNATHSEPHSALSKDEHEPSKLNEVIPAPQYFDVFNTDRAYFDKRYGRDAAEPRRVNPPTQQQNDDMIAVLRLASSDTKFQEKAYAAIVNIMGW